MKHKISFWNCFKFGFESQRIYFFKILYNSLSNWDIIFVVKTVITLTMFSTQFSFLETLTIQFETLWLFTITNRFIFFRNFLLLRKKLRKRILSSTLLRRVSQDLLVEWNSFPYNKNIILLTLPIKKIF